MKLVNGKPVLEEYDYSNNKIDKSNENLERQQRFAELNKPQPTEEELKLAALDPEQRKFVEENKGIGGSLRVGLEAAGNEALFGLPEMAYKKFADPKEVKLHEALQQFHQTANTVGSLAGAIGSLYYGGPLFKGAATAGRVAEGALTAGRAAEEIGLARVIAAKALGGAVEQSVISAPHVIGEAIFQDPKTAGEDLLVAAGIGGLFGPTLYGLKKATTKAGEVLEPVLGKVDEFLNKGIKVPNSNDIEKFKAADDLVNIRNSNAEKQAQERLSGAKDLGKFNEEQLKALEEFNQGSLSRQKSLNEFVRGEKPVTKLTEAGQEVADQVISKTIGKIIAAGATGFGVGHLMGGNGLAGALAGIGLFGGNDSPAANMITKMIPQEAKTLGLQAMLKANLYSLNQINKIPEILESLSKGKYNNIGSSPYVLSMLGKDIYDKDDDYKTFKNLSAKLADNMATQNDQKIIGDNASHFNNNTAVQSQYSQSSLNALNYLNQIMPKNPNPPMAFTKDTWKPNEEQLKNFHNKLEVINNPYIVLDKLHNGTLNRADMEVVQAVYPAIYNKIHSSIMSQAVNPKYQEMPFATKAKLSVLLGQPLDNSFKADNIKAIQDLYKSSEEQEKQQNKGSLKGLSKLNTGATNIQKVADGSI